MSKPGERMIGVYEFQQFWTTPPHHSIWEAEAAALVRRGDARWVNHKKAVQFTSGGAGMPCKRGWSATPNAALMDLFVLEAEQHGATCPESARLAHRAIGSYKRSAIGIAQLAAAARTRRALKPSVTHQTLKKKGLHA